MKISSHQALLLYQILYDTLHIQGLVGGLDPASRLKLLNTILSQQSTEIIELDNEKTKEST